MKQVNESKRYNTNSIKFHKICPLHEQRVSIGEMILTAVNPSTNSKTCSNVTVFTTNPILTGLELSSGLYNERPSTICLSYVAYFVSTNLNLTSPTVYRSEGICVLSIQIHVLNLYLNYIIKMDGSHCKISGGTSQNVEKFGFIITASQTLQCLCAFTFGSLRPADFLGT